MVQATTHRLLRLTPKGHLVLADDAEAPLAGELVERLAAGFAHPAGSDVLSAGRYDPLERPRDGGGTGDYAEIRTGAHVPSLASGPQPAIGARRAGEHSGRFPGARG